MQPLNARILPGFQAALAAIDCQVLESDDAVIYGVSPDDSLAYYNPAWVRFARANGAPAIETDWPVGRSLLSLLGEPLRGYYRAHWQQVRATGEPWTQDYECSSPERRRRYWMNTLLLEGGWLLVSNVLYVEGPHGEREGPAGPVDEAAFRNEHGFVRQCAYCRCSLQVSPVRQWRWVPAFLDPALDRVTHGMCELCFEYHIANFTPPI